MENYHVVHKIGQGSYGEVLLVKHRKDRRKYVLKQINLQNATRRERLAAHLEVKLLSALRHPNIVPYRDSFETNGYLYIAMGFCEGGDMYARIKEQRGVPFGELQIVEWFIQICMALQYLHERNIMHRDLKTQNVFLTRSHIIKVGDLGIAKVLDGEGDMATTLIGTPYYMSPELFSNKPYNYKSDVWALGCCVYEMATLRHAFNARDINSLMYKILRGKLPSMPKHYSSELLDLIRSLLHYEPEKRPSVARILKSSYIKRNIALFLKGTEFENQHSELEVSGALVRKQTSNNSNRTNGIKVEVRVKEILPAKLSPAIVSSPQKINKIKDNGAEEGGSFDVKPAENLSLVMDNAEKRVDRNKLKFEKLIVNGIEIMLNVGDKKEVEKEPSESKKFPDVIINGFVQKQNNLNNSNINIQQQQNAKSAGGLFLPKINQPKFSKIVVAEHHKQLLPAIQGCEKQIHSNVATTVPNGAYSSNSARYRRRMKNSILNSPFPVQNARPLSPLPLIPPISSSSFSPRVPDVPIGSTVVSTNVPSEGQRNSSARQRRREKIQLGKVGVDGVVNPELEKDQCTNQTRSEREEKSVFAENSQSQESSGSSCNDLINKNNEEIEEFIQLLNSTLKGNSKSPPMTSSCTKETQTESAIKECQSCFNDSRLERRISVLKKDCLNGLGETLLEDALKLIDKSDSTDFESKLQLLLNEKFEVYAGLLWQLKLCEKFLVQMNAKHN